MWNKLKQIKSNKILRFLIGGGIAAAFNLVLIAILIDVLGFNTPILRSIANVLSIEASLVVSFFIYRAWVWRGGSWSIGNVLLRQLPLYHLSAGASVACRILILFPVLDWLGINYAINTLIGVGLSAAINYVVSDKLVFREQRSIPTLDLYPPEGLSPALEDSQQEGGSNISHIEDHGGSFLLSIVIPAYNEEGSIGATVQSMSQRLEQERINYEILIVNDNSRDKTESVLQYLSTENENVRYINNYYPNGFGFAVRCGLENFNGDAVVIAMADGSDPPENIVDYYRKFTEGYDCIFGSRFVRGGAVIGYPKHKLFVNRLANLFVQVIFAIPYNDITNAFKGYKREVIEGVSPLISHHFNLTVEIPLKAIIRGYSYTVIPIKWYNRKTGISKLKINEMGSRYLFIVLYALLEKTLSKGDYISKQNQLAVRSK